jgi:hypothetical protein
MKLAVSYNEHGEITVMFNPSKMGSGDWTVGYEPAPGEKHHVLDLPNKFEGTPLQEIVSKLRVHTKEGTPRLEEKA